MKYLNLFLALLLLVSSSFALTNITSIPFTISSPDTYVLTGDLTNGTPTAISITSNDVILDCQGFSITGLYTNSTQGIFVNNVNNITIQNCVVNEYGTNLLFNGGNVSLIQNNTFNNASHTGVVSGTPFYTSSMNATANRITNSFDNGWENYFCYNCNFDFNNFSGQLLGHGTDRAFQFISNNINSSFSNNFVTNNTFAIRLDNNNLSNIMIANNVFFNNLNGINEQSILGGYSNVSIINNSITSTIGPDLTWGGITTSALFCNETTVENNTVTGNLPYMFWKKSNAENQTFSNLNIGAFAVCDADNLVLNNITTTSNNNNFNEFMQNTNTTLDGLTCNSPRICLRLLTTNDSTFSNIYSNGGGLSVINLLGGLDNRNNLSNVTVINLTNFSGIALGGNNNTVDGFVVANSTTTGMAIGYSSTTVGTGNLYLNGVIQNVPLGILFTTPTGNFFRNIYLENVTQPILVNSTASGSKTYIGNNITIGFSGGVNTTSFDIADIVVPNQSYTIKPVTNPYGIPVGINDSFRGKALNLTIINTTTAFSGFNFTWLESEVSGFNELSISLYSNNGSGWVLLNDTPDTTNNRISFTGPFNEGSSNVLALFSDLENCPVINESGNYLQTRNYINATNPSAPFLEYSCVDIRADNVIWDCNGFSITNNDTTNQTVGILVAGNNVTVRNCNITGYNYEIYSTGNNQQITNNTLDSGGQINTVGYSSFSANGAQITNNSFNNLNYGMEYFFGTDNTNVSGNRFTGNVIRDIDAGTTTGSNFEFNNHSSSNVCLALLNSNNNVIRFNNYTGASFIALQLVGADNTQVIGNLMTSNSYSIDLSGGSDSNNISLNVISNTLFGSAVSLSQSSSNTISTNNISGTTQSLIYMDPTSGTNIVTNNALISSAANGVHNQGNFNTITLNSISNTINGILLEGNGTVLVNNLIFANVRGISVLSGTNNLVSSDHLYGNNQDLFMNNTAAFNSLLNATTEIFDNPSGTLVNYSQISFGILLLPGQSYSLSWALQPTPDPLLPLNTTVPGQFLNFTTFSGTPSITSANWFFTPTVVNSVIFYNGTWNNLTHTDFVNRIFIPTMNVSGIYALANVTLPISQITLVTLDYLAGTLYINYTTTSNTITVQDTGNYLLNYVSVASGSYFGDTFIFSGFIQIISAVLPVSLVLVAVLVGFTYYKNRENK